MIIDRQLHGRRVVIAHESAFQGSYIGEVTSKAGASIVGLVETGADGIALLGREPHVDAMVLSQALPRQDAVALIAEALARDVRTVVVHPGKVDVGSPFSDHRCLPIPHAGFQIVAALVDVLAATRGCIHWSSGKRGGLT